MSPSRRRPSSRARRPRPTGALPALTGQVELAGRTLEGVVTPLQAGNRRRGAPHKRPHNKGPAAAPAAWRQGGSNHMSRLNRFALLGGIGLLSALAPVAAASAATPAPGTPWQGPSVGVTTPIGSIGGSVAVDPSIACLPFEYSLG